MLSVVLVDDHAVVREGIAAMLDAQPEIQVIGHAGRSPRATPSSTACWRLPQMSPSSPSSTSRCPTAAGSHWSGPPASVLTGSASWSSPCSTTTPACWAFDAGASASCARAHRRSR